jgi:glycosyltransferase involved in cell wall biosynthesis
MSLARVRLDRRARSRRGRTHRPAYAGDRRARYDIAFYVPWIGPLLASSPARPTGGAETQIFLLARGLARRGSRVCLLVFDIPGVPIPLSVDGVDVSVRPPYKSHQSLGKLRESLSLIRTVMGADADLIVTRSAGPHVGLVGIAAKLRGQRFVFSSANVSDFRFPQLEAKWSNRELFRLGIRLADEIVVQTTEQIELCEERFRRTPVLIKSIAETARQWEVEPQTFLWVGRLVWYKRPLAFIELARRLPEARFSMVGVPVPHAGDGTEFVEQIVSAAEAVPNLELLAPRPRRDLLELFDRAVAVVNTADFEGMPNVFLEGWAQGVPALALSHDPDGVIEAYGLGAFAHGSLEELEEHAMSLWRNRGSRAALAERCRQYVRDHHSPDAVSAQWQEALGIPNSRAASLEGAV